MGERVRDGGGGTAQRRTYSPCHAGQDSLPRRAGGQLSPPAPSLTGRLSVRALSLHLQTLLAGHPCWALLQAGGLGAHLRDRPLQ